MNKKLAKKEFEALELEIINVMNVDVITTSGDDEEIVLPPDPFSIF